MPTCTKCSAPFPEARKVLGFSTCTKCGEQLARKETARRKTCVAPAYNKGAYQYVATISDALNVGK